MEEKENEKNPLKRFLGSIGKFFQNNERQIVDETKAIQENQQTQPMIEDATGKTIKSIMKCTGKSLRKKIERDYFTEGKTLFLKLHTAPNVSQVYENTSFEEEMLTYLRTEEGLFFAQVKVETGLPENDKYTKVEDIQGVSWIIADSDEERRAELSETKPVVEKPVCDIKAQLTIEGSDEIIELIGEELRHTKFNIGRGKEVKAPGIGMRHNDLALDEPTVSRAHAHVGVAFTTDDSLWHFYIESEYRTDGTLARMVIIRDNQRIERSKMTILQNDDKIEIGRNIVIGFQEFR